MKKSILLGAAALMLIATSCSNDETVEMPKGNAIGFKTMVDKNQGRAAVSANDQFTSFKVWGYKNGALAFNGQDVTGTLNGSWNYTPLQYWVEASKYSFTAVGSGSDLGASTAVYTAVPPTDFNQAGFGSFTFNNETAAGNEDVVYAYASRETASTLDPASTEVVGLAFKHSLARVKFTFNNGFSEAYTMQVKDLTINNAISSGTFALPAATWTKGNETFALAYDDSEDVDQKKPAVCNYQYIIPTPEEQVLEVSFTVVITNIATGDAHIFTLTDKQLTLPASGDNAANIYLSGHSYNFIATLNQENVDPDDTLKPIIFNVEDIADWIPTPDEEGTVTVQ